MKMKTESTPPLEMKIEVVAEFMLGGMLHDAVRVLQEDEDCVLGEEAIRRAELDGRGHVVRSGAEWQHVKKNRHDLPQSLNGYWLATARPYPGSPRYVSYFCRYDREWHESWDDLDYRWYRYDLVLRRRA